MSECFPLPLNLRFKRYECKYLLTESLAARVRNYVAPYVEPDPFAASQPDGRYPISSLYLDSDDLRLYQETLAGIRDRFKLRIRAYTDRPEDPVFVEVKKRRDRVILKERCRIRRQDMIPLVTGGTVATGHMSDAELGSLDAFVSRVRVIGARPRVFVRYEREALRGVYDPEIRVTFDWHIRSLASDGHHSFLGGGGWNDVEAQRSVLEFKFNDRCPRWIADAIRRFNLDRVSYSKYGHAVEASVCPGGAV